MCLKKARSTNTFEGRLLAENEGGYKDSASGQDREIRAAYPAEAETQPCR